MGRSGYSDGLDNWELICWRGAVASAIRGKRGQAFLRELLAALDAVPTKELISGELIDDGGAVCAIGSVGVARGMDMSEIESYDPEAVAHAFGATYALTAEIEYMNDEANSFSTETPEQRWARMRAWVTQQIREES
jgi:hypothetical protein